MVSKEAPKPRRQSENELKQQFDASSDALKTAQLFWLSHFWQRAIFCPFYSADKELADALKFTQRGNDLIHECCSQENVLQFDAQLALFGHFFWHDVLVDVSNCDLEKITHLLSRDILDDKIRIPFSWGRQLHDKVHSNMKICHSELINHSEAWQLLNDTPQGVFQHGHYTSGPLGIIASSTHRWIPVFSAVSCFQLEGTRIKQRQIPIDTASIGIVHAFSWFGRELKKHFGESSDWERVLAWHTSRQHGVNQTNYVDIALVIADCILDDDRTLLLESLLKTHAGTAIREGLARSGNKGISNLPPREIAQQLDGQQQLQVALIVSDELLATEIDRLVLSRQINIPASEVRHARRIPPARTMTFQSELSSLGIRPGNPMPFAALSSAILGAYDEINSVSELHWRLGSDPDRGVEVSLTEFIRRMGPDKAIEKLILCSQPVTEKIAFMLNFDVSEIGSQEEAAINRILWKFGFEIARHDDILDRFKNRLESFEKLLVGIDFSAGESAKEKIRSEGVNLFVSAEEVLDRLISYNVWLLASDHWRDTRFSFHLSEARKRVASVLGGELETPEGTVRWKVNGENALGTQLAYLNRLGRWVDELSDRDSVLRSDISHQEPDPFGRPFPFRHTMLWADSSQSEMQRYSEALRQTIKSFSSSDIAGVRNGIDHQRDGSRFPNETQLDICVAKLRLAIRYAEEKRLYPITYWLEEQQKKAFGSSKFTLISSQGSRFSIYRPTIVSSLPKVSGIRPILIAPVNFLGVADGILHFRLMGESNFSKYWADYPRVAPSGKEIESVLYEDVTAGNDRNSSELIDPSSSSRGIVEL